MLAATRGSNSWFSSTICPVSLNFEAFSRFDDIALHYFRVVLLQQTYMRTVIVLTFLSSRQKPIHFPIDSAWQTMFLTLIQPRMVLSNTVQHTAFPHSTPKTHSNKY